MDLSTTMVKPVKIGTHDGAFHCDEVFACVMLRMLPEFSSAPIVRTRKPELLAECDVVVDVGAVYDHAAKRSGQLFSFVSLLVP